MAMQWQIDFHDRTLEKVVKIVPPILQMGLNGAALNPWKVVSKIQNEKK